MDLESHLGRFGLSAFRPGQREVVSSVLAGDDCLCIMPTGGGKSLCYQLPAIARPGVTLVVSPLIALMKDQVDSMLELGLAATFINSSLHPAEQRERMEGMKAGRYELVYIAPERLRNPRFVEAARASQVQLLAVDEAHCISEWGHDFRPDYARLGKFRARLGLPQTIALTATATPTVREDVVALLNLRQPKVFVTGFARPNLKFEVEYAKGHGEKRHILRRFLAATPGAGIIYAATRKACEELAEELDGAIDRRVGLYHAGLAPDERRQVQERFMSGKTPIIVATNAFGMGIDKADLRFVVHYNMPRSLEAYYQEAGRAGRDGLLSRCLLLFSLQDRRIQEYFIENAYPTRAMVAAVYEFLRESPADPIEITLDELKQELKLSVGAEGVGACERLLEKAGAIERLDANQNMAAVRLESDLPTLVDLVPREAANRRKVLRAVEQIVGELRRERVYLHPEQIVAETGLSRDAVSKALRELNDISAFDYVPPFRGRAVHVLDRSKDFNDFTIDFDELERRRAAEFEKLDRVIGFAQTGGCRQREILEYFGDHSMQSCGTCDNCTLRGKGRQANGRPAEKPVAREKPRRAKNGPVKAEENSDEALRETVRIALSGAARANGRIGKTLLAKMLCGSESAQITKLRLNKLSTYGLLHDLRQSEVNELLDALLVTGLLEQIETQRFRPVVQITPRGAEVMRGAASLPPAFPLSNELRSRICARLPAAASNPKSKIENPKFAEPEPLPAPEPDWSEIASADLNPKSKIENPKSSPPRPPHYWTWRLLSAGFDVAECAEIRGLDAQAVLEHAAQAAEEGLVCEPAWVLSPAHLASLGQLASQQPLDWQPLLNQLPAGLKREHVRVFVACRKQRLASAAGEPV
jgi:ATP-dependent DNA helicase RecQ